MHIGTVYLALAAKLQEAAQKMSTDDVRTRISDALRAATKGTDSWSYVVAIFGDDKSGDVVYSCNSDLKKAPYAISGGSATIDTAKAIDVAPLTTYEPETVMASEAGARNSKRDMMQLQSIHDHAAALGANCSMKESATVSAGGALKITESTPWGETLELLESSAVEKEVKIIAPGKGSSAFYTAEVLKRDGPKVFTRGTQMFVNHATRAEEAARPEGDWHKLVGALTSDAVFYESHAKGPGLYAKAKFASDLAPAILEKAPFSGVSIRANGTQATEAGRPATREGVPVLGSFTSCESIDIVTRAGAGGMILTEAAKAANLTEGGLSEMDAAEIKKLQESVAATNAINAQLMKRALRGDALELAGAVLSTTSLTEAQRKYVAEQVVGSVDSPRDLPMKESGVLDAVKLTESVNATAKAYSATLPATGRVIGMGAGPVAVAESAEQKAAREARTIESESLFVESLMTLGLSESAAKAQAKGVAA